MWVFKVYHKTRVLDLEMLLLILHDLKIKGISQIINYNTFGYEEIILADIYISINFNQITAFLGIKHTVLNQICRHARN